MVLDTNATLSDPELSVHNNWNNAVLTLARQGGANGWTMFGVKTGSVTISGDKILVSDTIVGTVTNANGTMAITFNASATNANVNSVLQAITYKNNSDTPPASVTIGYTINDGDTDPERTDNPQGAGGAKEGTGQILDYHPGE